MKSASAAAIAVILLAVGCRKEEAVTAFDAERAAATRVTVKFDGIIVHTLGNGVQRAVIPRLPGHRMHVNVTGGAKADVEKVFPGVICPAGCDIHLGQQGAAAFRIVKVDGQPINTNFSPDQPFRDWVIKLSTVPSLSGPKPFETAQHVDPALFDATPSGNANGNVVGWFELAGGSATAIKYGCPAKFENETGSFREFAATVTVTFADAAGLKLQVMKPGGKADWSDAAEIPLTGNATIKVNNDHQNSNGAHFKMLAALSTRKDSQGNPLTLPAVITQHNDCEPTSGAVPGCSNSSWP